MKKLEASDKNLTVNNAKGTPLVLNSAENETATDPITQSGVSPSNMIKRRIIKKLPYLKSSEENHQTSNSNLCKDTKCYEVCIFEEEEENYYVRNYQQRLEEIAKITLNKKAFSNRNDYAGWPCFCDSFYSINAFDQNEDEF